MYVGMLAIDSFRELHRHTCILTNSKQFKVALKKFFFTHAIYYIDEFILQKKY